MKARPRLLDWAMTVLALDCDSAHSVRACRRAETAAMLQNRTQPRTPRIIRLCNMMLLTLYSTGYCGSYRLCSAQAVSLIWRASHTRSEVPHRQLSPVGKPVLVVCCSCCWVAAGILLGDSRAWSAFVLRLCTCRRCAIRLSHVAGATCPGIASILRSKKSSTPQSSSVPSANLTRNSIGAPDAAGPRISTCSGQYICKIHIDICIQMLHINVPYRLAGERTPRK